MAAQAASCVFLYGLPYLLPELRRDLGLSLASASTLLACPLIGVVLALIAWGAAADRYGERLVITAGLVIASAALAAAANAAGVLSMGILLAVAGMGGASVNAASGRLVLGWFGARERGLAMGARQTAQPLGTMLAAAILPAVTAATATAGTATARAAAAHTPAIAAGGRHGSGIGAALYVCAALCLVTGLAVAFFASDPPRPLRAAAAPAPSPYRLATLWRIHGASTLLVVPQFVVTGFVLEYLVNQRGWDVPAAGRAIAVANLAGALTRLAAGRWSDHVQSRLRPMRQLSAVIAVVMGLAAVGAWLRSPLGAGALLAAAALTVSTNGLAFTAVAELAGMSWAGRALGVQNTAQNIAAAATPPVTAQAIELLGYPAAFGITALFPVAAVFAVPAGALIPGAAAGSSGPQPGSTTSVPAAQGRRTSQS